MEANLEAWIQISDFSFDRVHQFISLVVVSDVTVSPLRGGRSRNVATNQGIDSWSERPM